MASIASPTLPANTSFCIPESKRRPVDTRDWPTRTGRRAGSHAPQLPPPPCTNARENWDHVLFLADPGEEKPLETRGNLSAGQKHPRVKGSGGWGGASLS